MKKILLSTAAVAVLALAAPAHAEEGGVQLELGGYFKGYLGYLDQSKVKDTDPGTAGNQAGYEVRDIDWLQDSEIHVGGETTLDNNLTIGAHFEADVDNGDGNIEESYLYFSSENWGRVNLGNEDGAAFLLQVAAPSADENYDGVRQYISPFNYDTSVVGDVALAEAMANGLDYAQDPTGYSQKVTYLSPKFGMHEDHGLQVGLSYTPTLNDSATNAGFGFGTDKVAGAYGSAYEAALRYDGAFQNVGVIVGGGYSRVDLQEKDTVGELDDRDVWNVGLNLKYAAFSLGGAYLEDNQGKKTNGDETTWVVGADYTTGPFKFGLSYLNQSEKVSAGGDLDTDRYTGGVVYQYAPGMTFRGSLSYVDHTVPATLGEDLDGMTLLLGTQVNF
ncbi:MAG TPA: porin [Rhodospirillaceae bacterium]|jgi:outer membrane protein OmpU|nr:porin [Alphaproteobacteria bacterium]HBH26591.1 porin [Rhodospirillaceae bacterium]